MLGEGAVGHVEEGEMRHCQFAAVIQPLVCGYELLVSPPPVPRRVT